MKGINMAYRMWHRSSGCVEISPVVRAYDKIKQEVYYASLSEDGEIIWHGGKESPGVGVDREAKKILVDLKKAEYGE
jgi:hypothetical protein